jgi:hypothetical protein
MAKEKPATSLERVRFGQLLARHMERGTRPGAADQTGAWTNKAVANLCGAASDRTVQLWKTGERLPQNIEPLLEAFFGDDHAAERLEFVAAYAAARGQADPAPAPAPPRGRLRPPQYFMGRDADVATVRAALLAEPAAILLHGPGGIGKTALTQAAADQPGVIARFGEARWFAALETAQTADLMKDAVVRALGCDPGAGFAAALARVAGRPGLLILDNLETPWEAEREAVEAALADLAEVPGLALLASLRGAASVAGPDWTLIKAVERLAPEPAQALFRRHAGRPPSDDRVLAEFTQALGACPWP